MNNSNNQNESSNEIELSGDMLEILKIITFAEGGIEVSSLARQLNFSNPKVQYFLDELEEKRFIRRGLTMYPSDTYYPTKEGRKYLFEHDLL